MGEIHYREFVKSLLLMIDGGIASNCHLSSHGTVLYIHHEARFGHIPRIFLWELEHDLSECSPLVLHLDIDILLA